MAQEGVDDEEMEMFCSRARKAQMDSSVGNHLLQTLEETPSPLRYHSTEELVISDSTKEDAWSLRDVSTPQLVHQRGGAVRQLKQFVAFSFEHAENIV